MERVIKLDYAYTNKGPIILDKKIYFLTGNKNKISEIMDFVSTNTEYFELLSNQIGFISMELEEIQCENSSDLKIGSDEISKNKIQKAVCTIKQMVAKNLIKIESDEVIFICEDTSLYMSDSINSFPGPYIKFMMPSDIINFANGIEISNKKADSRKAFVSSQFSFIKYLNLKSDDVLVNDQIVNDQIENMHQMPKVEVVCGTTQGTISNELRGLNGWSFDLCFIPCIEEFKQSQLFSKYFEANPDIDISVLSGKTYSELIDADASQSCRLKNCISHRIKALDNLFSFIKKFNLI